MKIKTSELQGAALDWAVAKCEEAIPHLGYRPSDNWEQGGPIIEREKISAKFSLDGRVYADPIDRFGHWEGPTPLIAAMRCYVASKLGDEVEVPDELGRA